MNDCQNLALWDGVPAFRPVASTPYIKNKPGDDSQEDQGRELRHLSSQLRVYQEQLEEYECMKADWQVEKEALEDVLMGLRKQLREKEAAFTAAQVNSTCLKLLKRHLGI